MTTTPTIQSTATPTPAEDGVLFDVRPIPCRVKHGQIVQRWLDLPVGRHFVLLNDHDPVPLRYQFEAEYPGAIAWEYLERGPDNFRVKITKLQPVGRKVPGLPNCITEQEAKAAAAASAAVSEVAVDARGLQPPEPLIRILNALETLPLGATLRARTDREPCHLFGEAVQRGFRYESKCQPDGSWLTVLARA